MGGTDREVRWGVQAAAAPIEREAGEEEDDPSFDFSDDEKVGLASIALHRCL